MIAVRTMNKKEILQIVKEYLDTETEYDVAAYRKSISPALIKRRDGLRNQLKSLVNTLND